MEPLAAMEVERQIRDLPPERAGRIDRNDVLVRTLNRLPPLYATTAAGWNWHRQKVRDSLGEEIRCATAKAIREASDRDGNEARSREDSQAALSDLKQLLGCQNLSWPDVVAVISETLDKTAEGKIARHPSNNARLRRSLSALGDR